MKNRESGLVEISEDEPKGMLSGLLRTAKDEQKLVLTETRKVVKLIRRAEKLVKTTGLDVFGESYAVRRHKKFKRLIDESLQLAIVAKVHVPVIETVAKEVKEWLSKHKKAAGLVETDKKIIEEVAKAKRLLDTAVKNLTDLDEMSWGTAPSKSFFFGMYYVPVEHESEKMTGLKYRAEWILPLRKAIGALEAFEKAVEEIYGLQKRINKEYRK